jgi:hypothetical protein
MRLLTFEPKVSGTWNPQKTQLQVKIFRYKDAVTSFFRSGQVKSAFLFSIFKISAKKVRGGACLGYVVN